MIAREIPVPMDCAKVFLREISVPMDIMVVAREISVPMDIAKVVVCEILVPMDIVKVLIREILALMDAVKVVVCEISVPMDNAKGVAREILVLMDIAMVFAHEILVLMDIVMVAAREISVLMDFLKSAAAIAWNLNKEACSSHASWAFSKDSKRASFVEGKKDLEKERWKEEEEQERKEEEIEKEKGVLAPALVILQQTAKQRLMSCDVQLEGNRVGRDLVNILVQGMDGKHSVMTISQGIQVSQVVADLSRKMNIPVGAFYLTLQSKVLHSEDRIWMGKDERLVMHGRLRGGMEGDWTCQHCGRQGCWVTKVKCYRCGKSKYDQPNQQQSGGNANVPGWIRTQAQQQTEREWNQATRGAGVGLGSGGQPLGQKPAPPQQGNGKQKQKSQAQSRSASPAQEEDAHEVL